MFKKTILLLFAAMTLASHGQTEAPASSWIDRYDSLVKKYVSLAGVNYKKWKADAADMKQLGDVMEAIGQEVLTGKSREERLAFYLNAYNAHILQRILQDYPTDGPGGGGLFGRNRFFKAKILGVAGQITSFDLLENEIIRPQFEEPRIHFALNCASASCPPLHPQAFRAATLDATLTALTKAFVTSNPEGVKNVGWKKVSVSKIFDWYGDDFEAAGGVLSFINQYRDAKLSADTQVSFHAYSWVLNATR